MDWKSLPNSSTEVNLGNFDLENGEHTLLIYTSNPNDFRDLNQKQTIR